MGEIAEKKDIHYLKFLFNPGEDSLFQQKLADFFPAIIYVVDTASMDIRYINKKVPDLLGYSNNELSLNNNDLFRFMAEGDSLWVKNEIKKCMQLADGENHRFKCRFINNDGDLRTFTTEGSVIKRNKNGDAESILCIAQPDATPSQKLQEITSPKKIDSTERCLNSDKDNLLYYKEMILERERFWGYGSWEFDLTTNTFLWSDGMYELFGYDARKDKERLVISEDFYYQHMSDEQIKSALTHKKQISENLIADYSYEYEILTPGKEIKKIESYKKIIRDQQGKPIKYLGLCRDITSLRHHERKLELKIQELKRSNAELEEFAYIASHDLQEPLRKLTTFNERLRHKFSGILDADASAYLTRMNKATQNMRVLIDNLLEFSRVSRSSEIFTKTNLQEVLKTVITDLELIVEETGTSISFENLPEVEALPGQMSQLFNNLIGNAIKFREANKKPEIYITCSPLSKLEKEEHQLFDQTNKNFIKIQVKDNGIGFEEVYSAKIFQIFQRLHGKSEYPGSGIGLSICKKIVENHKGKIYAESNLEQGSVFSIILPVIQ